MTAHAVESRAARRARARVRGVAASQAAGPGVTSRGRARKRVAVAPRVDSFRAEVGRGRVSMPVRGCSASSGRVTRPAVARRSSRVTAGAADVRLTDRGIAVVLFVVALISLAAVWCIGSTAWQVMSEPVAVVATR